jgi:hypothetical protein
MPVDFSIFQGDTPPPTQGTACVDVPAGQKVQQMWCGASNEGSKAGIQGCYPIGQNKDCVVGWLKPKRVYDTPATPKTPERICVAFENESDNLVRHIAIAISIKTSPK